MTKFLTKFENPVFGPFSNFGGEIPPPPRKIRLSNKLSYEVLAPCQNYEKTNDTFLENAW